MKSILKYILKYYLKYITKIILFIHRPTIIAISGSTNKTIIKDDIKNLLTKHNLNIRANTKSFNTEIGLPLAILNLPSGYNSYKNWLPIIFKAPLKIFETKFPKILILELGVDKPGDMKYLLSIIKPDISIITEITQRYLESFGDLDELIGEYKILVKKTKKNKLILLNSDNQKIKELSDQAKAKFIFFGKNEKADYQAQNIKRTDRGECFDIVTNNNKKNICINKFGEHHVYSTLICQIIIDKIIKND